MSYYLTLHENMKRARLNANLTQAQVAEKVGITARQYQRYESGASAPYIYDLPKICEALGVSYEWLFGDSWEKLPSISIPSPSPVPEVQKLFDKLDETEQAAVIQMMKTLIKGKKDD